MNNTKLNDSNETNNEIQTVESELTEKNLENNEKIIDGEKLESKDLVQSGTQDDKVLEKDSQPVDDETVKEVGEQADDETAKEDSEKIEGIIVQEPLKYIEPKTNEQLEIERLTQFDLKNENSFFNAVYNNDVNFIDAQPSDTDTFNQFSSQGLTPLIVAVYINSKDMVNKLIEKGALIDKCDDNGFNVLNVISFSNKFSQDYSLNSEILKIFIDGNTEYLNKNEKNISPVQEAVQNSNLDVLQIYIEEIIKAPITNELSNELLTSAVESPGIISAQYLLTQGFDINAEVPYKKTPLEAAISAQDEDKVNLFIYYGANANPVDSNGEPKLDAVGNTLLNNAISYSRLSQPVMQTLIDDCGADISTVNPFNKRNLLLNFLQSGNNDETGLDYLLSKNFDLRAVDINGNNIVYTALTCCPPLLKRILEVSPVSNLDVVNKAGLSPLLYTAQNCDFNNAKQLLDAGASLTVINAANGESALHLAVKNTFDRPENRAIEVIDLLSKPELINLKANNGYTPLHMAASAGKIKFAEELIKKGADSNITDNDNHKFYEVAELGLQADFQALMGDNITN